MRRERPTRDGLLSHRGLRGSLPEAITRPWETPGSMTESSRGHGKRVTDEDILAAVRGTAEPVTSDSLAERVEVGQREVLQRLREVKEVGDRGVAREELFGGDRLCLGSLLVERSSVT